MTDSAPFAEALDAAENTVGQPDIIFCNAARVLLSILLTHDVNDIEYDLKVSACAVSSNHLDPILNSLQN